MQLASYKSLCSVVVLLLLIGNSPSEQQCATKPVLTPNNVINGTTEINVQLRCSHSESNSFKWILNGSPISSNTNFLWVLVPPLPGGVIQCGVDGCNLLSDPVTIITQPVINSMLSNLTVDIGGNFSLKCQATGYPTPIINWYHNNVVVSINEVLMVDSITFDDNGQYTCLVHNDAGYTTLALWVFVPAPMESVSSIMVTVTTTNSMNTQPISNIGSSTITPTEPSNNNNNEGTPINQIRTAAIIVTIGTFIILNSFVIIYCSYKYCCRKLQKRQGNNSNNNKTNSGLLDVDLDELSTIKTSTSYINASFKEEDEYYGDCMKVELYAVSDSGGGDAKKNVNGGVLSAYAYKVQNANLYDTKHIPKSFSKERMSKIQKNQIDTPTGELPDTSGVIDSKNVAVDINEIVEHDDADQVINRTAEDESDIESSVDVHNSKWLSMMRTQERSHLLDANEIVRIVHKLDLMSVEKIDNHPLREEFEVLPFNLPSSKEWPRETVSKNRYADVFPTPNTAVTLSDTGEPASTYINANYIRGYDGYKKTYISAQAPTYDTVPDFWRMVWENHVDAIVMLTGIFEGGKNKCAKYWPSSQESDLQTYGRFMVQNVHEESYENYKITFLSVCSVDNPYEERDLYHFCFLGWPDFGSPNNGYGIMQLRNAVESIRNPELSLLVHCSAGLGRSGTYIGIDIGIHQYDEEGKVDPLLILGLMRSDRGGMIQSLDQYVFLHRVLSNYAVQNPIK